MFSNYYQYRQLTTFCPSLFLTMNEIDVEDRELIMNLTPAYLEWERITELRGLALFCHFPNKASSK
ncbi:MAG: hypothetical protein RLZZ184_1900 [Cyanobacteriota bacterium]